MQMKRSISESKIVGAVNSPPQLSCLSDNKKIGGVNIDSTMWEGTWEGLVKSMYYNKPLALGNSFIYKGPVKNPKK